MPPIGGIVNLREDPSADLRISENIGSALGSSYANYKIAQQDKIRQQADANLVGVLSRSAREGWDDNQLLSSIYEIPNVTQSQFAMQEAARIRQFQQQDQLKEMQYQSQQTIQDMRNQNAYDMLNQKYDLMLQNAYLTNEQKAQIQSDRDALLQSGRVNLADINNAAAIDRTELQQQGQTARNQADIDYQLNKPIIQKGADGRFYQITPINGYGSQVVDGVKDAIGQNIAGAVKQETGGANMTPMAVPVQGMPQRGGNQDVNKTLKDVRDEMASWGALTKEGNLYLPSFTEVENARVALNNIGYDIVGENGEQAKSPWLSKNTPAKQPTYRIIKLDGQGMPTQESLQSPLPNSGQSGRMVRVISPDGQTGTLPIEDLEEAIKEGYKQVQ
jgi:hypothetical protein